MFLNRYYDILNDYAIGQKLLTYNIEPDDTRFRMNILQNKTFFQLLLNIPVKIQNDNMKS